MKRTQHIWLDRIVSAALGGLAVYLWTRPRRPQYTTQVTIGEAEILHG